MQLSQVKKNHKNQKHLDKILYNYQKINYYIIKYSKSRNKF